jgi:hypothetical protein
MNKTFVRMACVVLGLLAAGVARAQISDAAAEQLMRLSGGWAQLASLAPQLKDGFEKGLNKPGTQISPDVRQKLAAAAARAFDVDRVRSTARRTLAEGVRAGHVPELLAWYQGQPAQRITRAEEEDSARAAETEAKVQAGVAVLQGASPQRRQLLARLVEVTRAAQTTTDTVVNVAVAVQAGVGRFDTAAPQPDEKELRATLEAQRPEMLRAFEGLSLASFALVYKDIGDEDLSAYASFLAGAAGEHYTDLSHRAFEAALLGAFNALGR